jgi:hypothetical protein
VRVVTARAAEYLEHLRARDGTADLDRHVLVRREALMHELALHPVRSRRVVDAVTFRRNLARAVPEPGLDDLMLWLLATAKANQAERFAVSLAELYGLLDVDDPVRVHTSLQEIYHTRLLAEVVALFGLTVRPRPPAAPARLFIKLLLALPERAALPLTGAAEMAGCVLFRTLRDRGVALLADEPAIAARVRLHYDQILADEIGHVGYIALMLGRGGRALMRTLYRVGGPHLAGSMPELVRLFGTDDLRRRFRGEFRLDALIRDLPGGAYAAATP